MTVPHKVTDGDACDSPRASSSADKPNVRTTLGLPFLPPGHASKIHVHTADNNGDPDDAARPANK